MCLQTCQGFVKNFGGLLCGYIILLTVFDNLGASSSISSKIVFVKRYSPPKKQSPRSFFLEIEIGISSSIRGELEVIVLTFC